MFACEIIDNIDIVFLLFILDKVFPVYFFLILILSYFLNVL